MAGNVVSNVKKYYGGQVPVPGQGDSDGKVKVLVEKTATIEIGGVQTEVELLYDADDLTTPVTPQQLGQWTDENYLIAFKAKDAEGTVRGFILYALETDSTSTDTLVNRAEFVNFKGEMNDPGASAYVFEMVEDSSTLNRYLRDSDGELIVKFNQSCVEAGAQSDTLDNLISSDSAYMRFEVVHEGANAYLNLNTESLGKELDNIWEYITDIIDAINELPSDEHGYFNSSLYTTPGDGTTTNLVMDNFRITENRSVHGDSIEFVPTHQEGGVDFGEVYLNPGTYILNVHYTLQWVGNPRGTFQPLVANVGEQPFDFSYEHEDILRSTRIVTKTTRGKFGLNFPFDADTPPMGIWVKYLEIAQIASYNHPAVVHDTTLTGKGQIGDPLGVTPAAFGKVKDIPTSISQFRTGDVIPVDRPNGPAKMGKDDLLTETAQNALAGNVAPAFVPNSTTTSAGLMYIYNGTLYVAKEVYQGPWDSSKFERARIDELLDLMLSVNKFVIRENSASNPSDLNDIKKNKVYLLNATSSTQTLNLPSDFVKDGSLSMFSSFRSNYNASGWYGVFQFIYWFKERKLWRRSFNSQGSWSAWTSVIFAEDDGQIVKTRKNMIFDASGANPVSLDDVEDNSCVAVIRTDNTSTTKFPSDYGTGGSGLLSTFKSIYSSPYYLKVQILVKLGSFELWYRTYNSGNQTWGNWNKGTPSIDSKIMQSLPQIFDASGANPASLNDVTDNCIKIVQRTSNTTTTNFPTDYPNNVIGLLEVYKQSYSGQLYQVVQVLTALKSGLRWYRSYNSGNQTWGNWNKGTDKPLEIIIGEGQTFTTLREGFEAAFATTNAKVLVMPGTYDLTVEFADILDSITTDIGLRVGNGMHIIFADGAKVTANFTKGSLTDSQWTKLKTYFAPIWVRGGGFTIENMDIEATDCRYCVHDERGNGQLPYINKYINCRMKKSSTESTQIYAQCIGGGLGSHGTIIVDGGYYESNPAYGAVSTGGVAANSQCCISYHNDGYDANAKSSITIKNVYLANRGFFEVLDYGTTTKKTPMYISGCSFGLAPLHLGANSSATTDNTEFVDWQNTQRINGSWNRTGLSSAEWVG